MDRAIACLHIAEARLKSDDDFGCEELLNRVNTLKPKIHCFGHVHGRNGIVHLNRTMFINAAMVNSLEPMEQEYRIAGKAVCVNLEKV